MPFVKGEHHSKETREKMRISHTGSHHSLEHCKRISDAKKGKTHLSEETRKRMSESAKKRIRVPYSLETRQKMSISHKGKKHTPEHCRKNGEAHKGERSGVWKGGTSFYPYCPKFNNRRKKNVRSFFNGFCIVSGEHQNDCLRNHSVHHIDSDKEQGCNGKPFNLVPMNTYHHCREHAYHKEYQDYINKTLREGFKWGIWNEQEYIERVMYEE